MKGYVLITKIPQRRLFDFCRSKTYRNARWEPEYEGSKKYILTGDEVQRGLRLVYRLTWRVSYRDENGKGKKRQTHLVNIQHWRIVDEFKDFFHDRQWTVEDIKEAIDEFVEDKWIDCGVQEQIEEAIALKLFGIKLNPLDGNEYIPKLKDVISKVNRKWLPIKREIIVEFVQSSEFRTWLSNEAVRAKGPRKPTIEELRAQQRLEKEFESFKQAFGGASRRSDSAYGKFTSGGIGSDRVHVKNREIALKIVQAGFRVLAKKHHSDTGGDDDMMRVILETKDELIGSL